MLLCYGNIKAMHRWTLLTVALLLIAAYFTVRNLDADPYWVDEVIAAQRSGTAWYEPEPVSLGEIWNRTALISDQVPGFYMALGLWSRAAGITSFAGRMLAMFFGLLSIATAYQLGRRLHSPLAGFGTALALVTSTFYMLFFHEMRMYSLLMWLIAALLWCYWEVVYGKRQWYFQAGLVFAVAGMMYSYYLSIVVIAAVCLFHLLFVRKDREWLRVVVLIGTAGVLFLPWFLTSFSVFADEHRNAIRQIHSTPTIDALVDVLSAFSNRNILFLGLLLLFSFSLRNITARFGWFVLLTVTLLMVLLNPWFGVFVNLRYTLLLWIPLALVAGFGIAQVTRRGVPAYALLGLLFASGLVGNLNRGLAEEYDLPIRYLPWDTLTETIRPYEQEGDVLTFLVSIEGNDWEGVHEERVMPYYFFDSLIQPFYLEDVRNLPDADFLREGEQIVQAAQRLWVSYAPKLRSWRMGLFEAMLREEGFVHCATWTDTDELHLDLYAHPRALDEAETLIFYSRGAAAEFAPLQAVPHFTTREFMVTHGWRMDAGVPRDTYSMALHIYNEEGVLVQTADYGLPGEAFGCVLTLVNVSTLPAGAYELRGFVYAWQTGERLVSASVTDQRGALLANFIVQ